MALSFENRIKYIVRYMYDIDNNGVLDQNDFDCLAVKNTIIECKGDFPKAAFENNQLIMRNLWNEIAELADFDKNGEVDVDEFKNAVITHCVGKPFADFPNAFKAFIENQFKSVDVDGDGLVGLNEYRQDVITRAAFSDIAVIDNAWNKLLSDTDRAAGGITLPRYQELFSNFIANKDESHPSCYLFGPLMKL
ncbi:unnamed protein product [Meganyctiphanes norvegica]|uniref:EF-hand domain-containing protein n=1 Tax=Meganyctiphanes norvegica TaxID=48144 RepID=A0AAV2QAA4_MEGNR